jgi:hypothetical protein
LSGADGGVPRSGHKTASENTSRGGRFRSTGWHEEQEGAVPRRTRDRQDRLGELLTQVERRFQNSPLQPLGDLLVRTWKHLPASAQSGFTGSEAVDRMVAHTSFLLEWLPHTFGERFDFDSQLLSALVEDCSQGGAQFSINLIPKPFTTWGHHTVEMPSTDGKLFLAIDLIHFPGEDNLSDIDLLDYPFACHELGHNLLFKPQGGAFCESISRTLEEIVNGLHRQTLSLQGAGKDIALSTIEQIRRYWTPTPDHRNWAHEIAVDVIALWTCGPAYLAALQDVLEHANTNPYQLGQSHPPYEVRAKAMIEAANQLGWAYYTGEYQTLIEGWPKSPWAADQTNLYAACADPRLVNASVAAALETCRSLALPCCTAVLIESVREKLRKEELPDLGIEIIIAAWVQRGLINEGPYVEWERSVIRSHLDRLTT